MQRLLGLLHHDHGGTVTQEDRWATGNESAEETLDSLRFHDVTSALRSRITNSFSLSLWQVLEHFKWPDKEPSNVWGASGDEELTPGWVEEICILTGYVNEEEIKRHHDGWTRVLLPHSKIKLIELPLLTGLPLDFGILEGTLDEGASWSTSDTGKQGSPFETKSIRNLLAHRLIWPPTSEECLKDTELDRAVDNRSQKRWQPASIEANRTFILVNVPDCLKYTFLEAHMLTLCLHLSLNGIKGMSDKRICAAVKESTYRCIHEFMFPIATLLVVRHYGNQLKILFLLFQL